MNYSEAQTVSYTLAREDTDFLADDSEKELFNKIAVLERKMHEALG